MLEYSGQDMAHHEGVAPSRVFYGWWIAAAFSLIIFLSTGARFAVEGRAVIDCAVALHEGVFHLFAPDNGAGNDPGRRGPDKLASVRPREGIGYHATSKDGLEFTRQPDAQLGLVLGPLSMGQVLSLGMVAGAALILTWRGRDSARGGAGL